MRPRGSGRIFKRGNRWWLAYYVRGKEQRESGGTSLRDAQELLHKRFVAVHEGKFVGRERLSVNALLDAYVADLTSRRKKSIDRIVSHLRPVRAAFGDERLLWLTVERLNSYIERRRAQHAADGTITQEMVFLRSALRLAQRQERISSLPYVPTAGPGGVRKGFVDVGLFDQIHAVMPKPYQDMVEFAYLTGWRYQEICGLELAWVFLGDAEIRLPDTKNGQGRVIALEGRLRELVEAWWSRRRLDCQYLFHKNGRRVKHGLRWHWRAACAKVGIPEVKRLGPTGWRSFAGVTIHDLRRSAIRNMRRAGVSETVAMTTTDDGWSRTFSCVASSCDKNSFRFSKRWASPGPSGVSRQGRGEHMDSRAPGR